MAVQKRIGGTFSTAQDLVPDEMADELKAELRAIFARLKFNDPVAPPPDARAVYDAVQDLHRALSIPFARDGDDGDDAAAVHSSPRRRAALLRGLAAAKANTADVLGQPLLRLLSGWAAMFTAPQHRWSHRTLANVKVVVCGAGPVGLRAAVQIALMGADVTVVEREPVASLDFRHNVLLCWKWVSADLKALCGVDAWGAMAAPGADNEHVDTNVLQAALLRIALLAGVVFHFGCRCENILDPADADADADADAGAPAPHCGSGGVAAPAAATPKAMAAAPKAMATAAPKKPARRDFDNRLVSSVGRHVDNRLTATATARVDARLRASNATTNKARRQALHKAAPVSAAAAAPAGAAKAAARVAAAAAAAAPTSWAVRVCRTVGPPTAFASFCAAQLGAARAPGSGARIPGADLSALECDWNALPAEEKQQHADAAAARRGAAEAGAFALPFHWLVGAGGKVTMPKAAPKPKGGGAAEGAAAAAAAPAAAARIPVVGSRAVAPGSRDAAAVADAAFAASTQGSSRAIAMVGFFERDGATKQGEARFGGDGGEEHRELKVRPSPCPAEPLHLPCFEQPLTARTHSHPPARTRPSHLPHLPVGLPLQQPAEPRPQGTHRWGARQARRRRRAQHRWRWRWRWR